MRRAFIRAAAALTAVGLGTKAAAQQAPAAASSGKGRVKVAYQLSEGIDQAVRAMSNLQNHLIGAPDTKIVVVAFGYGVDFLIEGAKDARGSTFEAAVAALSSSGVEFRACRNTLTARRISEQSLLMNAKLVQAGVVEIARLQFDEGYAYIHP